MSEMKKVLVTGAGGFIGHHLVNRLVDEGHWVVAVDLKRPEFTPTHAHQFHCFDLRDTDDCRWLVERYAVQDVYHLAADMGGIGYIGTERFLIASGNGLIDANILRACVESGVRRFFYSSSACVYPISLQSGSSAIHLREDLAWPAEPEPGYGLEKIFMEKLCEYALEKGVETRVARFHNIYGPEGTWTGGKEKSPAAICRKVAEARDEGSIEIWGDGSQVRSYTFIEDCVEGIRRLVDSDCHEPLNIGSDECVTINELLQIVAGIAGKRLTAHYDSTKPLGVSARNSDNTRIQQALGWQPSCSLRAGLEKTYPWIAEQVAKTRIQQVA